MRLILGDCLDVLPTLASGNVDAVVTDPPYGISLPNNDRDGHRRATPYGIHGDNSRDVALAVLHWSEEQKLPTIVFASPWKPWPGRWRNLIVWDKGGGVGGGGDIRTTLKRSWELIQIARNRPMAGPRAESVWRFTLCPQATADHIAAKPLPLMVSLLERFTLPRDTILDPCMGNGTTGVACVQTGRDFIGIEIDPTYFRIAKSRIAAAQKERLLTAES
jgi:DNA modification methylase